MAGGEPRGPAGRGVLTWPAEPAEVVGIAAHGGAVGGGGEAVAAAQGLELHCVLQVGPAEEEKKKETIHKSATKCFEAYLLLGDNDQSCL